MFPYPSGKGLHVGHPAGYTASDVVSRYHRALGDNVLHPMGYDAFGLPAEQKAIDEGVSPQQSTAEAIENFRRQLKTSGSPTTGRARSRPPIPPTTSGRSGSLRSST